MSRGRREVHLVDLHHIDVLLVAALVGVDAHPDLQPVAEAIVVLQD